MLSKSWVPKPICGTFGFHILSEQRFWRGTIVFDMSLQELMNVEIALASKKEEKLFTTPVAAYVITEEDIRRSGATNVPELLRMVPGLNVARISVHNWAISSRGFMTTYNNKLLVMVDDRSIYNPLFGGVFWETELFVLENIKRIEVIRGPGGTLWGANAVNGIINIITKDASETQGLTLSGGGGDELRYFGAMNYGSKLNDHTYYRAYTNHFNYDDGIETNGQKGLDGWYSAHGGFRIDSQWADDESFTLSGGALDGHTFEQSRYFRSSFPFPVTAISRAPFTFRGAHILGKWTKSFEDDSELVIKGYFDRSERYTKTFDYIVSTCDLDLQHSFNLDERHQITWGLGDRFTSDKSDGGSTFFLTPERLRSYVYSGFEYQPSGRIAWLPNENETFWASISRAVHTPTRLERDSTTIIAYTGPTPLQMKKNKDFGSEEVIAYEAGYRVRPNENVQLDFAVFCNDYQNLRTLESFTWDNQMTGETFGGEVAATCLLSDQWKVNAGYSFLRMDLHPSKSSGYTGNKDTERHSPQNQFNLRSLLDLTGDVELDILLYYVDSLPADSVESYVNMDVRLGWDINPNTNLSVVGQNLLASRHQEFVSPANVVSTAVERGFYAKLTFHF